MTIEPRKHEKNMISLPKCVRESSPFGEFLDDMETLGVLPVGSEGQRYAVIAARTNQRWWLVPLDNRRATAAGFEMLQPVSLAAKLAKVGARTIAQFGPRWLLGQNIVRLSGLPDLGNVFGGGAAHMSFFTGTDGPHRKTAIQVMDADGTILGYAKLSREKHVRPYIRNEAEMLARVTALDIASADLPRVLALHDTADLTLLVTDSCKSADMTTPLQPGAVHLRWLDDLSKRTTQVGAARLLEELANRLSVVATVAGRGWVDRITRALGALFPVEGDISLCLVHGDFTPWNSFIQGGRLYVFDWEYAHPAWPVGFDLAHFLLATIPREQQPQELSRVQENLASAHFNGNESTARRSLLLSLVCHAVFYLERLVEVRGALTDWCDAPMRATLIDRLLESGRLDA